MLLHLSLLLLIPMAFCQQNPVCQSCSLGYPQPNIQQMPQAQSVYQQYLQQQPPPPETPTFSSYPSQPQERSFSQSPVASMYGGDAQLFGTELGRAIAQRIHQVYGGQSSQPSSAMTNSASSFGSYPSYSKEQSQTQYRFMPEQTNNPYATASFEAQMASYPGAISQQQQEAPYVQQKSSCPYCFGNQNNAGYGAYRSKVKGNKTKNV